MTEKAKITFVTGGSGGIGKSATARMLAHTLGLHGYRTGLVDGNPGQQSQRSYLRIPDSKALEYAMVDGLQAALVKPRDTGGAFALLAGPADPQSRDANRDYMEAIIGLRSMCRMIVVDSDRIDGRLWDDASSFAGGLMRPMVEEAGARIIFRIGSTGSQLDDGLAALDAIGRADATLAIPVAAPGMRAGGAGRWRRMLSGLASYGGEDVWDARSAALLDPKRRACGWPKGMEPEWLVRCAVWAGADGKRWRPEGGGRVWPWTR
ncbi:hypothetical protein [Bifidobacterium breve]|uniref:CobQ/CobB/MinD/ParA nucleotide binding domain-containing protein n=1 Tax=Bifidobacterium breve TaxID=1685 RepID=A0A2K9BHQ4_BIFBR|nr:hypothetical protein [Bifidobacterium breve]AUE03179.1 hypothetical protein BB215W447A_1163 [Bifidobacterium breve]